MSEDWFSTMLITVGIVTVVFGFICLIVIAITENQETAACRQSCAPYVSIYLGSEGCWCKTGDSDILLRAETEVEQ